LSDDWPEHDIDYDSDNDSIHSVHCHAAAPEGEDNSGPAAPEGDGKVHNDNNNDRPVAPEGDSEPDHREQQQQADNNGYMPTIKYETPHSLVILTPRSVKSWQHN
jgi:hypothetical protein